MEEKQYKHTKYNPDGSRSVYYANSQRKYEQKTTRYTVNCSLKDADFVAKLDLLIAQSGQTPSVFIKNILREYVENHPQN